ncbi:DEAD/DEAH box helicase family protein [Mammaliicoccus lentus]|uniref:DEAD/DEAH box helicase family protein n=1 Tax=Mammaliicoccus lentus TaxID=42858 RepID=UPI001C4F484E|nr:DEAD/DEAH box helicase family protein [Mammaliicoccus lentus]MBW0762232.1 DEAD/DEAH box helicase family protein [Mammaliicoccus lentus]
MRNFDFIVKKKKYKDFAPNCLEAEQSLMISPSSCAMLTRRALELAVKWVYRFDDDVKVPYRDNLSSLIHNRTFIDIIDDDLLPMIKFIIKLGNSAAHTSVQITRDEATLALNNLFQFISWIDYCYSDTYTAGKFSENILPKDGLKTSVGPETTMDFEEVLGKKDKPLNEQREKDHQVRINSSNQRREHNVSYDFETSTPNEMNTRKMYIDLDLKLAGWIFNHNMQVEYMVNGMPNKSGKGFVDYVLRGNNGKIIGLVEAKSTIKNPESGRHQAKLYADAIEREQGLRPVIFYTNGFRTFILHDDYPAREVSEFYSKEEIELLIQRRTTKKPLINYEINDDITNRYYQKEAIANICDALMNKQRKNLLVMATGSGKTRTAISIVDVLKKHNWIKNVLFLADRTALVRQAMRSFNSLMPDLTMCNLLDKNADPESSRMVFSTYPTMMNAIDNIKSRNSQRIFTAGYFDLIIIDESHRSIYQKYQSIFNHFDSLLIGLTATPKDEVDRNTYSLFELENGVPTYAYELNQAVNDGYLVEYNTLESKSKFLEEGIIYDELSEEEKEEYENMFDDGEIRDIDSSEINEYLFNDNTIDKVIDSLLEDGLKVEGGDKLGKTIIFAKNHNHASVIKKRFDVKYPNLGSHFAEVIDNKINYYQDLIDNFSVNDKFPQVAISVDMLDTGIDVPEVLNLVFFKKVRSKTKFWQMIGRGTRLCENIYGQGIDKENFLIFDWLNNFEFFKVNPQGVESTIGWNLTQRIYNMRLDIVRELQDLKYQHEHLQKYRQLLIDELCGQVKALNQESFRVKQNIEYVDKYKKENSWNALAVLETNEIKQHITPLIEATTEEELAKRFDLLILTIELATLTSNNASAPIKKVMDTAKELSKLGTIPNVKKQAKVIKNVQDEEFWGKASIKNLEDIRIALRELIKFIEKEKRKIYYTNFEDEVIEQVSGEPIYDVNDLQSYKEKVNHYIKEHKDHVAVYKLYHNKPLTNNDIELLEEVLWKELGSKEQYEKNYSEKPITVLVREIVGLDKQAVNNAFSEFLTEGRLNSYQIDFVKKIIDYISQNGILDKKELQRDPFRQYGSITKLFEDNRDDAQKIIEIIDYINKNAKVNELNVKNIT